MWPRIANIYNLYSSGHTQLGDKGVTYSIKVTEVPTILSGGGQVIPASWLWSQSWTPTTLWVHSSRSISFPLQPTLSRKFDMETKVKSTTPCAQITPASSLWRQSWLPTPLWVHSKRFVSFPLQPTLSKKIGSTPGSKIPLSTSIATASGSWKKRKL